MIQNNDKDPVLSMTTDEFAKYLEDKRNHLFYLSPLPPSKQARSTLMMKSLAKKSVQAFNAKRRTANKEQEILIPLGKFIQPSES